MTIVEAGVPYAELYRMAEDIFSCDRNSEEISHMCHEAANKYDVEPKLVYRLVKALYIKEFERQ